MPKPGPRTVRAYSEEFKATAVCLSHLPGIAVKDVAESLCIHPFMLSRWRKEAREGSIVSKKEADLDPEVAAELKELRKLKKAHARLQQEHDILKKPSRSLPLERGRLPIHRALPGSVPGKADVRAFRGEPKWVLRLDESTAQSAQ